MKTLERILEWGGIKKDITLLIISLIALLASLFEIRPFIFDLAWISVILCGVPIVLEAIIGLVTTFDIKADVLVSLALIASLLIGEDFAAGEVAFIMQLGALLEDLTVSRARAGIEKLIHLTPRTARRLTPVGTEMIPASDVCFGDHLRVLPGETVPVDGEILSGTTSINQAVMTGESLPVDKGVGDEVSSGTVNLYGSFDMKALKVGEDSSIQRMIRLIQSADAGCALVLATPIAIMAAIGNATRHGFLVREGDALERLSMVKKIAFDKTGTLTEGNLHVKTVHSILPELSDRDLYRLTAAAELRSEHPLGKAVVSQFQKTDEMLSVSPENFQMIPGRGVSAVVNGQAVLAGNGQFMEDYEIPSYETLLMETSSYRDEGCTVIYVSVSGKAAGFLVLSDTLRENAARTIDAVRATGISPVLLTGDHKNTATHIGTLLHIDEIYSDCLPEEKLSWIEYSQEQHLPVCMIGDGINDAPSLKKAFVGIAMGGIGSDIAVDAADIALVNDDIRELPHLIALSKKMMFTIKCNLTFSMALNFFAIVLAILGILNPVVGALVHNAGSVFVIIHSAFLLTFKNHKNFRN